MEKNLGDVVKDFSRERQTEITFGGMANGGAESVFRIL